MRSLIMTALLALAASALAQPIVGTDISHIGCQTVWPNNGSLDTFLDRAAEAGIDTVRSDAMWWGLIEYPNPGEYHFDGSLYPGYGAWNVDNWVSGVTSRGMEPYVIMGYNNSALYSEPPSTPADFAGYAAYCAAAAARYADDVDIWEIWNEPNISMFWGGTPDAADYTALVAAAAPAIRAADSTAIIVGGVTSGIDIGFLTSCFNSGLLSDVDVISVHPYRTTAPETVAAELAALRSLMNGYANGSNVTIWTGEWGYNTYFSEVNEEGHAKCVLRMMLNNPSVGVEHSTWFSIHAFQELDPSGTDSEWGLLNRDLTRRPSFYAMQTLNEHLPAPVTYVSDPFSTSLSPSLSNQRVRVFERGSSDHRTVGLWLARWPVNSTFTAEQATVSLTVPIDFELRAYDGMDGAEISIDARRNGGQVDLHTFDMWDYPILVEVDREVLPTGSNAALGAVAHSTDSDFSPSYGGDQAYDGVISDTSKWTSEGTAPPHWLALDLGATHGVTGAVVRLPSMAGEFSIFNAEDVEIQVGTSLSGPWTTVASETNAILHDRIITVFASPEAARFVRLVINDPGTDSYARIPEFEVHSMGPIPAELTVFSEE
ncbi:cellulase family glycosylhydrolase [Candidatus Sumerlaeota bacterium]|nr:cellulase family glycosylhydrolase [Candidatus Sumerlaeota bacterium]